jgi:hypothetical protein
VKQANRVNLTHKNSYVVFDFAYFRESEAREKTIENSEFLLGKNRNVCSPSRCDLTATKNRF